MSGSHNYHAKISPSSLERTAVCTASTDYVDKLKEMGLIEEEQSMNKFGAIGTMAHDLAEEALLHLLGKKISKEIEEAESLHRWLEGKQCFFEGKLEQDGFGDVENYVDYCMSQIKDERDIVYVEVRSKLFYSNNPKDKGTCDFLILHYDGSITIVDLKWRRSGMVESYQNLQLSAYGLSYIENKMLRQPKADTPVKLATYNPLVAPYVAPWKTNVGELKLFCKEHIVNPLRAREAGLTMFVPTEKACQWCPAKKHCTARMAKVVTAFPETFDASVVAPEDLVDFLKVKKEAVAFFDDIESRLFDLADQGNAQSGTKLVEGRSNRRYEDPAVAGEWLEDHLTHEDIYDPPKIKSFSKITPKLTPDVKKTFETQFLIKPKGKMKLVLSDDSEAPAVTSLKAKLLKSKK